LKKVEKSKKIKILKVSLELDPGMKDQNKLHRSNFPTSPGENNAPEIVFYTTGLHLRLGQEP